MCKNTCRLKILILLILFLSSEQVIPANFYRSTTSPANWGAGNCWSTSSCGTGGLTIPSTSSDIVYIGCASKITNINSGGTCGDLNISNGTVNLTSGTLTVNGNLNLSGGALNISGGTLIIYGNFNKTGGTFTHSSGAVNLAGTTAKTISSNLYPLSFYELIISGGGDKTMNGNVTITNKLTLTMGNLVVGSNTLTIGTGSGWGSLSRTNGKISINSTSPYSSFSWGADQTIADFGSYISNTPPYNINNWTMTYNLCTVGLGTGQNMTVNGSFTLTAGDFQINSNKLTLKGAVSGNINGSIIGSSASDLTIEGSGSMSMYFDLLSTTKGGTNTIRNFYINRSGTFNLLSSIRIGNTLSLVNSDTYFKLATSGNNTITFDGTNTAWEGLGYFQGNSLYSNNMYIYGSGTIPNPLKFLSGTPSDYTLSTLQLHRTGATLQLGSDLIITSSVCLSNLSGYGSLDMNGKNIDIGSGARVYNESNSNQIFNSACPTVGLIKSTNTFNAATLYAGASQNTTYTRDGITASAVPSGYRGLGIDILTGSVAPGITAINAGFCERSGLELGKSILKYVDVSPTTNSGLDLSLTMYYYTSELNTLADDNTLGFYRDPTIGSDQWVSKGGSWVSQNVTLTAIDEFSSWTLGKQNEPMPVDLLAFEADCKDQNIELSWTTASETNCAGFYIERSFNASQWEQVHYTEGAGNSNDIKAYLFIDEPPSENTIYYRLKQVDRDGRSTMYGPVSANCTNTDHESNIRIFPNPARGSANIQSIVTLYARVSLCDITGRVLINYARTDLSGTLNLPMFDLSPGIYVIRIEAENSVDYYKIVLE